MLLNERCLPCHVELFFIDEFSSLLPSATTTLPLTSDGVVAIVVRRSLWMGRKKGVTPQEANSMIRALVYFSDYYTHI